MSVSNIACGTTGGTSGTFFITNCGGGYFAVVNNPASDQVSALFDAADNDQQLPDMLRLSSKKKGTVKEGKVRGHYSSQSVKDGLRIDLDVHYLSRGTYYLQGIYNSEKTESIRVLLQ
ncbi:hypothetical protein GCM10028773_19970 [Spirosoma koreense]